MIKEIKVARYVSSEVTDALSNWNEKHSGLHRISVLFRFVDNTTGNSKLAKLLSKHKSSNQEFRIIMELGDENPKSFDKEMREAFDEADDKDLPTFVRCTASVSELTGGKYTSYKTATGTYTSIRLSYFEGEEPDDWKSALTSRWNTMVNGDLELVK